MKIKRILLICSALCLLGLSMSACRSHGFLSDDFDAGDTVTPEELMEISRELFTHAETPAPESETESQVPETLAPDATVYWLKGGSVYHASRDCHHISHAALEDVAEGQIPEAVAQGKKRLCASCAP